MRKTIATLLTAAFALGIALPATPAAAASYSSEAKPAAKPRSVILSSYFEDGIVTKATKKTKKTKKTKTSKTKKAKVPKTKKKVAKKPAKKAAPKKSAKKKAKK